MGSLSGLFRLSLPPSAALATVTGAALLGSVPWLGTAEKQRLPGFKLWLPGHRCGFAQCSEPEKTAKVVFRFAGKTDSYTPVFQSAPAANTASVNTNGKLLSDYARSTGNVGMKADIYDRLYSAMLSDAQSHPGCLRAANQSSDVVAALRDLHFVGSFARVISSSRGAIGAAFIDVYKPEFRPMSQKNVALIYVEGPSGRIAFGNAGPMSAQRAPIHDASNFLQAVEDTAANVMLAVREYNHLAATRSDLPNITILQYCLVSGTTTRHPDTSKLDVAKAIVLGLIAGASEASSDNQEALPVVLLAYDEGVFERAVEATL